MKNFMYFIFVGCFFLALPSYANQCTSAKNEAEKKCDEKELASARAKLQAAYQTVNATEHGAARNLEEHAIPNAEAAKQDTTTVRTKCEQLIEDCKSKCDQVAQEKLGNWTPNDDSEGIQAQQDSKFCSQGKPKEFAEQAKKEEGNMGKALQDMMKMLAQLMGKGGDDPKQAEEEDPCANPHPDDPRCKTDVATADTPGELRNGEFRSDDGLGAGGTTMELDQPSVPMGDAGDAGNSKGQAAGAAMAPASTGMAGMGGSGNDKEEGSTTLEDGSKVGPGGFHSGGGGGGRGGGYGYGAGGSGDGNNAPVSTASLESNEKFQAVASDKLDSRGLANVGPRGGISGPLSMDNFRKVEKRVELERKSLDDL